MSQGLAEDSAEDGFEDEGDSAETLSPSEGAPRSSVGNSPSNAQPVRSPAAQKNQQSASKSQASKSQKSSSVTAQSGASVEPQVDESSPVTVKAAREKVLDAAAEKFKASRSETGGSVTGDSVANSTAPAAAPVVPAAAPVARAGASPSVSVQRYSSPSGRGKMIYPAVWITL
ncbi:MAG: hypothetical protein HC810_06665 [Acaryochloridaceae cyanobacterium RL_2_7]|nr:hypothetical protein [Acaryochloridaceae cyanobacterium RL_2_7]